MILTVLKTTFKKTKPKEVMYRPYRNFDNDAFGIDLEHKLTNCENYSEYKSGFLEVFNAHAPLKK